ncbi:MAG: sugar phosphate isomerase/epimerase family protein [Terracidiphilus sp.]
MTMPDLSRLSLNQITTENYTLKETVDACVAEGIEWIGAWRHKIEPVATAAKVIQDAGLRVSSLCRGGFFPAATASERRQRVEDNLRAIDEAAALGTDLIVLVCGPAPDRDLDAARAMVVEGMSHIVDHARQRGVRLGIEPLHPMYAAERSVIVTLNQANQIAEQFDAATVGVVVDAYHVWWDPQVYVEIARAGRRIFALHVSDWMVPTSSLLMGRGMMGQGVIELRRLRCAAEEAGYRGPIEVEIFNEEIWRTPVKEVVETVRQSYLAAV